jgi:hypothetical protein
MRDIVEVYNKIIAVIPDEQIELKNDLIKYIDTQWNKLPEIRKSPEAFVTFSNILFTHIPNIDQLTHEEPRWKFNTRDIFEGVNTLEEDSAEIRKQEDSYDEALLQNYIEKTNK